ncbi:hypothetical protein Ade02nite_64160 [Paractinoplanes deccanensis]|uniref:LPXTG cell wall anchor domain-containing protein n=1 Tax=Paractinoplanes deccanensis TaxID=113561 RepID=A0ABQ3YDB0_9ACTN|nr:LPXTG cell wall anchor domain-containing protein [Actinoplanes deccanensis]GID77775.1 hypothetical protein Ade02nite_64160 [Actinoplanes deccanensis]
MSLRSLAIPAALAAVALGGLAAPAQAAPAETEPLVGVYLPEQIAVIQGKSKTVRAEIQNYSSVTAKGVVLEFKGVDPSLGLTLPAGCEATSCKLGDLAGGQKRTIAVTLKPTGDKIVSSFTANVGAFETETTVVRSAGGVDLEVDPIGDLKIARGQSANVPVVVRNTGSETLDQIGLVMLAEPGLEPLTDYSNCVTELDDEELGGVICFFKQEFAPGATFTLPAGSPMKIKVRADAGGPYKYQGAVAAIGVKDGAADALAAKPGPKLTLEAKRTAGEVDVPDDEDVPEDINSDDNIALFGVSLGKSVADSTAIGGTFAGAVGDTKTVKVGVRNLGPTSVVPLTDDWFPAVLVSVPAGVKLTKVDEFCLPAGADEFSKEFGTVSGLDYICLPESGMGKGQQNLFTFTGVITGTSSAAGSVTVDGGPQDNNAKNDKAALALKVTGTGGQGGGEGDGEGLPVTGAPTGWVALGGALLLLAGAAAAYTFRRKRIITTL